MFWNCGSTERISRFLDELAVKGLVLTMNVVIAVKSGDKMTTTILCSS